MEITIRFQHDESARVLWLLRQRYGSEKAGFQRLARVAVRAAANAQMREMLADGRMAELEKEPWNELADEAYVYGKEETE